MIEDRLLSLIDTLYGAVCDPGLWATFLEQLADHMDGSSAWLSHVDLQERTGSGIVFGIDTAMQDRYFSYYNQFDPFTGYIGDSRDTPYDKIMTDESLIAKEDLLRSTFYAEFLQAIDVHSIAFVRLGRRGSQVRTLNINRSRTRQPFGTADLHHLRRIQAHVMRAVSLGQRLAEMQLSRPRHAGSDPILFLVDPELRIHHESDAAERWGRRGVHPMSARGRLRMVDQEMHDRLVQLVASTTARDVARPRGGCLVFRPRDSAETIEITVTPARPAAIGPFPTKATTLVAVYPVQRPADASFERFGFTPAEAKIAQLLLSGLSSGEIARQRGISPLTVRTHLSRLMMKTETHRQTDLVRTLMMAQR